MSFASIAQWINLGLDVANSGASIYGNIKMSEAMANAQHNPKIYTPSTTVVKKTKEEIALEKAMFEANKKRNEANDAFTRAIIFNKYVDTMPQQKKDHTTLYIAGGVAILLIGIAVIENTNKQK